MKKIKRKMLSIALTLGLLIQYTYPFSLETKTYAAIVSDVSYLGEAHTDRTISLYWTKPANTNYRYANIYKNGQLIGSVPTNAVQTFNDVNLEANTTYDYLIKSVDTLGDETAGVAVQVKTDAIPNDDIVRGHWLVAGTAFLSGTILKTGSSDGSIWTGISVPARQVLWKELPEIYNVEAYQFSGIDNVFRLDFYNSNKELISSVTNTRSGSNKSIPVVNGVKYIALTNTNTSTTYTVDEFKLFRDKAPSEVANAVSVPTNSSISIHWSNPAEQDFKQTNIYRGGMLLKSFSPLEVANFYENNLSPGTTYEYVLKTVDTNNNESSGVTIQAKTDSVPADDILKGHWFVSGTAFLNGTTLKTGSSDGDIYTTISVPAKQVIWKELPEVYNIEGYQLSGIDNIFKLDFYNTNKELISSIANMRNAKKSIPVVNGVKYIAITNTHTSTVYGVDEFKLFRDKAPTDASNVVAIPTNSTISLHWTIPTEQDFMQTNIYREGTLLKSVSASEPPLFYESNLNPGTSYDYDLKTVDTSGNESAGITLHTTTDSTPGNDILKGLWFVLGTGLWNGKTIKGEATDGDTNTYLPLNYIGYTNTLWKELPEEYNIEAYQASWSSQGGIIFDINFYDKNKQLIQNIPASQITLNQKKSLSVVDGVKYVSIINKSSNMNGNLYDFKLFRDIAPSEVQNVSITPTDSTISLYWSDPTEADYKQTNVYRDGTLLKSISAAAANVFNESHLKAGVSYDYVLKTVDTHGNESNGITIHATTNSSVEEDILKGQQFVLGTGFLNGAMLKSEGTDGDTNTSFSIGPSPGAYIYNSTLWRELPSMYDVDSYQINGNANGNSFEINFYDTNKQLIKKISNANQTNVKTTISKINGVKYISLVNKDTYVNATLKEFKVFGFESKALNVSNFNQTVNKINVNLTWNNPLDSNFKHVIIYRNNEEIAQVTGESYTDSNLESDTTYTYKIVVIPIEGAPSIGLTSSVTTEDVIAPQEVTGKDAEVTNTQAVLHFTIPNDTDFSKVKIFRNGNFLAETTSGEYTDNTVEPKTTYVYVYKTVDTNGNESVGESYTITTYPNAPAQPNFGETNDIATTSLKLSWDAVTDAEEYIVKQNGVTIYTGSNLNVLVENLSPLTTYRFDVYAKNITGVSPPLTVTETTHPEKPVTPVGTNTTYKSTDSIQLSWSPVENAEKYIMKLNGTVVYEGIQTTALIENLQPKTNYTFEIIAKNITGSSTPALLTVQTNPVAPTQVSSAMANQITNNSLTLTWDAIEDAEKYIVKQNGTVIYEGTNTTLTIENLQPKTNYTFEIIATNITGESIPNTMVVKTNPDKPVEITGTTANEITNSSIKLSWNAVADAGKYIVKQDGVVVYEGEHTTTTIEDLNPKTVYVFEIIAKNITGENIPTIITVKTNPDKPTDIMGISANNINPSSIKLSWDSIEDAETYIVKQNGTIIYEGTNTTITVENLQPKTNYIFEIVAKNITGESTPNTIAVKTNPDKPVEITGTATNEITKSSITLSWNPVVDAEKYIVKQDGVVVYEGENTTTTIENLNPKTVYVFEVIAKNITGENMPTIITVKTNPEKPTDINGISANNINSSSIKLTWDAIEDAETYIVKQNGTVVYDGTNTTVMIEKLQPKTDYIFEIIAKNITGESTPNTITVKTNPEKPVEITGTTANEITKSSITLSWNAVADAEKYIVKQNGVVVYEGEKTTTTIENLNPKTVYVFEVIAKNITGENTPTIITVKTNPDKPTDIQGISANNINPSSIKLSWDTIEDAEKYVVKQNGTVVYEGTKTTITIENLQPKTDYIFEIIAKNITGESAPNTIVVKTNPDNPAQIKGLSASNISQSSIKLSWDAEEDAERYIVKANGNIVYEGTDTTFTIESLQPKTNYTFEIIAKNVTGESSPTTINIKTYPKVPEKPKEIQSNNITQNSVELSWNPVTDAEKYILKRNGYEVYSGNNVSFTDIGLLPGTTYAYEIISYNISGSSEPYNINVKTLSIISMPSIPELSPIEINPSPVGTNPKEADISKDVTRTESLQNGKDTFIYSVPVQVVENAVSSHLQLETVVIQLPVSESNQIVSLPKDTVETLKSTNTNMIIVSNIGNLTIQPNMIPSVNSIQNVQVEIQKETNQPVQVEQNKGIITGEKWAKIDMNVVDNNQNPVQTPYLKGNIIADVPKELQENIFKSNVYKYNSATNSYDVVHSKTEAGKKVFSVDGDGGEYIFGVYDKDFKDVPTTHWAKPIIDFMTSKHLVDGTNEDTFEPDKPITRAEFASMLVRAMNYKTTSLTSSKFKDIKTDAGYYQDLLIAEEHNLIRGISSTKFAPDKILNREESIAILIRVMEKEGQVFTITPEEVQSIPASFTDGDKIAPWARETMAAAIKYNITKGLTPLTLEPKKSTSRAQAAVLVQRTLSKLNWY